MEIKTDSIGDISILRLSGELEYESGEILERAIDKILSGGSNKIILELGDISYVNSAGLRVLVQIWKEIGKKKAAMRLCNLSIFVQKMFRITNLNTVFTIHSTENDAVNAFKI